MILLYFVYALLRGYAMALLLLSPIVVFMLYDSSDFALL